MNKHIWTYKHTFGTIKVFDHNGELVATFCREHKEVAFEAFKSGLEAHGQVDMFHEDVAPKKPLTRLLEYRGG